MRKFVFDQENLRICQNEREFVLRCNLVLFKNNIGIIRYWVLRTWWEGAGGRDSTRVLQLYMCKDILLLVREKLLKIGECLRISFG